jgi:hypothetical protein
MLVITGTGSVRREHEYVAVLASISENARLAGDKLLLNRPSLESGIPADWALYRISVWPDIGHCGAE